MGEGVEEILGNVREDGGGNLEGVVYFNTYYVDSQKILRSCHTMKSTFILVFSFNFTMADICRISRGHTIIQGLELIVH